MTETSTAPDPIAERFARETAEHEMTILHDQGIYRHLKFKDPKNSAYWYELITAPNSLTFRGNGKSFVFSRLHDMFEFFRSNPDRKTHRISPDYWAEKLTSDRGSVRVYSREKFEQRVAEDLEGAEKGWPGITAAWTEHASEDGLDYDLDYEEAARQALSDFEFGAKNAAVCPCGARVEVSADDFIPADWRDKHPRGGGHPYKTERISGFRFEDTWEWDFEDFHWWFLWALHGIVAGIAQYDEAKAQAARPVETVAVTSGAVA